MKSFLRFVALGCLFTLPALTAQDSLTGAEFSDMDSNEDGLVSEAEFLAYHEAQLKRAFAALDQNRNATLEKAELGEPVASESGLRFNIPRIITVRPERGIHDSKPVAGTRGPSGPMSRRISR